MNTTKMAYIMFVYETDEGSWSSGMILSCRGFEGRSRLSSVRAERADVGVVRGSVPRGPLGSFFFCFVFVLKSVCRSLDGWWSRARGP